MALLMRGSAVLLALLFLVTGCGYHATVPQSRVLGAERQVWVPFFANESISPTAQTILRRAFYDELHALRGVIPAERAASADLVMNARLLSYSTKAMSYSALDQAREYSLTLDVELEITRKGETVPLWKGQLQGSKQFPASANLAFQRNAEDQALDAAARTIAHKFISALEEFY